MMGGIKHCGDWPIMKDPTIPARRNLSIELLNLTKSAANDNAVRVDEIDHGRECPCESFVKQLHHFNCLWITGLS